MAREEINIDFEAAYNAVNKSLPAQPSDNASNYSQEWKTEGCVGTLFTDVSSTLTTLEQTVNAMRTYLNRLNELAGAPQPELPTTGLGEEGDFKDYDSSKVKVEKILYYLGYTDLPEYSATTANVNVRPTPGTSDNPIDTLPSGTDVTVVETGLGKNGAWNLVSYTGKDGLTHFGYVSSTAGGNDTLTPKEDSGVTKEQVAATQQFVRDNQDRKPGMAETSPRFKQGTGEARFQKGASVTISKSDGWAPYAYGCNGNSLGDNYGFFAEGTKLKVEGDPIITKDGWTAIKVTLENNTQNTNGETIPAGTYYVAVESGYSRYVDKGVSRASTFDITEGGDS